MRWLDSTSFVTDTGCTVRVVPHRWADADRPSDNTLLILRMDQPGDGREAEVMLTPVERVALRLLLEIPLERGDT